MDTLPIQASSVPCERVFSSVKATMAPRRSWISSDLMEALQLLKFSIRNGVSLDFTSGLNYTDELEEMELGATLHSEIPENVNAYVRSIF
jgi:hypothetical protein